MANVHVLESVGAGRFRVAYHVVIPTANNAAGISWRVCVTSQVDAAKPSVLRDGDGTGGTISAAEKAQIVSGAIAEIVREEKGQTGPGINAMFAQRSAEVLAALQARLAQFGRIV